MKDRNFYASLYWTSFIVVKAYIILNILVAVIFEKLESYNQQKLISGDMLVLIQSLDDFKTVWETFDPNASNFIPTRKLPAFMMRLKAPIGFGDSMLTKLEKKRLLKKFIDVINVQDHGGFIYFPELLWSCMF